MSADAKDFTLAELCITAAAEAWLDAGETLASGLGVVSRHAASLAKSSFSPDLMMTDSECLLVTEPVPPGPRRGYTPRVEGWLPFRKVFELLWSGRLLSAEDLLPGTRVARTHRLSWRRARARR